jgi:hypothetical protein
MGTDIYIKNVNVKLLRKQRNFLLELDKKEIAPEAQGLINLLDYMLDKAEGYEVTT